MACGLCNDAGSPGPYPAPYSRGRVRMSDLTPVVLKLSFLAGWASRGGVPDIYRLQYRTSFSRLRHAEPDCLPLESRLRRHAAGLAGHRRLRRTGTPD